MLGIAEGNPLHHFMKRRLCRRFCKKMHMIGHQAIAEDGGVPFLSIAFQQVEVHFPVFGTEEYLSPIVAPLDNVMRESRCNSPSYSWHRQSLYDKTLSVKKNGMCPEWR
jgi:hypothetical protein